MGTVHLAPGRTVCDRGQSPGVSVVTTLGPGRSGVRFSAGLRDFSPKRTKRVVWPTQPTIQLGVNWPGQADCSPTSVLEIKNECIFICTALYAFILAQGLYLFLSREPVLWVTGRRLPCHIRLEQFYFPCPYFSDCSAWVVCDDE